MAGYSGKSLAKKLGLKAGMRAYVNGAPANYFELLTPLPANVHFLKRPAARLDFIHVFAPTLSALLRAVPHLVSSLDVDGMLWLSWPKRASGIVTDVGEADVRRAGLDAGLVNVKICAVDETWSGLKFVYRLDDRSR